MYIYIYREREYCTVRLTPLPTVSLPWHIQFTFLRFSALPGNTADWIPLVSYCSNSSTLSLLRNIQRPIVKQISFTATCSGMPYIFLGLSYVIRKDLLWSKWAQIFRFSWVKLTIIPLPIIPPPHLKMPEHWVISLLSNVTNENPFKMVN